MQQASASDTQLQDGLHCVGKHKIICLCAYMYVQLYLPCIELFTFSPYQMLTLLILGIQCFPVTREPLPASLDWSPAQVSLHVYMTLCTLHNM